MVKTRPEYWVRSAGQDYANWPLEVLDSSKNLIALKADFHRCFPRSTSCRGRTFHHMRPGLVWHLAKINWPLCTWKKELTQWAENLNNMSAFAPRNMWAIKSADSLESFKSVYSNYSQVLLQGRQVSKKIFCLIENKLNSLKISFFDFFYYDFRPLWCNVLPVSHCVAVAQSQIRILDGIKMLAFKGISLVNESPLIFSS